MLLVEEIDGGADDVVELCVVNDVVVGPPDVGWTRMYAATAAAIIMITRTIAIIIVPIARRVLTNFGFALNEQISFKCCRKVFLLSSIRRFLFVIMENLFHDFRFSTHDQVIQKTKKTARLSKASMYRTLSTLCYFSLQKQPIRIGNTFFMETDAPRHSQK